MPTTKIPTTFPLTYGAVGGAQAKVLIEKKSGMLRVTPSNDDIAERYEICADLVDHLNAYCRRKLEEHPDWTVTHNVERAERGLRQKVLSGEWPLSEGEIRWVMTAVAVDQEEQAGRRWTIEKLRKKLTWYTPAQLYALMESGGDDAVARVARWEEEKMIFSVEDKGLVLYAKFQFDLHLCPIPIVQKILELLSTKDGWAICSWFAFQNGWISDEAGASIAPFEVLGTRENDVLAAAHSESAGTHFA
jgi:hypothetical protein